MIEMNGWMATYQNIVNRTFGDRIIFIGLQGSYGRGEAGDKSDIDVVLILDQVGIEDLKNYKRALQAVPFREKICGFVSGRDELANWCKSDLFFFYHDTKVIQGSFLELMPTITMEDAKEAVRKGAGEIYHACSSNFVHKMDETRLFALYKSAFFVLQAKLYCENKVFYHTKNEMSKQVSGDDEFIVIVVNRLSSINRDMVEHYSSILLRWSSNLILAYSINE